MTNVISIATHVPHVITRKCNFCSKARPEHRLMRLSQAQLICDDCLDWHNNAIEVLAGGVPSGCQECGRDWNTLRDSQLGVEVRMYVLPKDGILQVLCPTCVQPYMGKRTDLFKGTKFGSEVLKI